MPADSSKALDNSFEILMPVRSKLLLKSGLEPACPCHPCPREESRGSAPSTLLLWRGQYGEEKQCSGVLQTILCHMHVCGVGKEVGRCLGSLLLGALPFLKEKRLEQAVQTCAVFTPGIQAPGFTYCNLRQNKWLDRSAATRFEPLAQAFTPTVPLEGRAWL